jgi:DNA-binding LytR/AlgR family response regulator
MGTKIWLGRLFSMKPHVLILEDDFILSEDIADLVLQRLHAIPVMANSVSKALKLVPNDIALAFLDIDVRDGLSYPVAQKLMENEIPLVFVSGKNKNLLPDRFRKVPFVSKPAPPRILVQLAQSLSSAFG